MNKSHFSQATNSHPVVTPHDVGSFVNVKGVGTGILRYVGPIQGKDGLFCGIELDQGIGKHNGTYQGVSYFSCRPEHGIFAPMYKVELDEPEDVPMMSASTIMKGQERLSRSALPSLNLKNVARPIDPMMQSIMTDGSIMDGSLFSRASWGDVVDMCASNTTYVIPPGKAYLDDEEDLMALEMPKGSVTIDREALKREEERLLGQSYVVENPRFGIDRLPVVEDEDEDLDLVTPMVEIRPLPQEELSFEEEEQLLMSPNSATDTGYHEESDASRLSAKESEPETVSPPPPATPKKQEKPKPKVMETPVIEKKAPKEKEAPPAPKFPVKPKPLSKHQIMMQQLKASIEADKSKPKKEVKARVPLIPPPPPPKQKENDGDKMTAETPKRPAKQPLKTLNETPKAPPVERPKKERKPLYVAPPLKERKEPPVKKETPSKPASISTPSKPASISSRVSTPVKDAKEAKPEVKGKVASFPTSSFAGGKHRPSTSAPPGKGKPRRSIDEPEKLLRLQKASTAAEALAVALAHEESQRSALRKQMQMTKDKLASETKTAENLRSRLSQVEKQHREDVESMKNRSEQVTRSHAETVDRLKTTHEAQLNEKSREAEKTLEDERIRHEAEVDAMNRRHQTVIMALDEKIAESEKTAEQLKLDKKSLQTALANDSDQRNQMLTKEINSLQTALEFKNNEMKELRQKYQQVALRVEEIPLKELEITKLKHKVTELKQALDQKITYERLLVHQNEELKRSQLQVEEEKDSMRRSIDVMLYHYENGEDPMTSSKHSTPVPRVTFRSRSSTSSHRPTSGIPPEARLSMSSCSDMDRSIDRDSLTRSAVSMFASHYKLPENHAEDVIYAPDEIITGGVTHRSSLEEDPLLQVNGNDPQTDSGIVLS